MPEETTAPKKPHKKHKCQGLNCPHNVGGHPLDTDCPVNKAWLAKSTFRLPMDDSSWLVHDGKKKKAQPRAPKVGKRACTSTDQGTINMAFVMFTPDNFEHDAGPNHAATSDGQDVENATSSYQGHTEDPIQSHSGFASPIPGNLDAGTSDVQGVEEVPFNAGVTYQGHSENPYHSGFEYPIPGNFEAATSYGQGVEDAFDATAFYQGQAADPVQYHSGFASHIPGNVDTATSGGQGVEEQINAALSYQGHVENHVQTYSGFAPPIPGNLESDIGNSFVNQSLAQDGDDHLRIPGPNHAFYSSDFGLNGPDNNSTGRYCDGSSTDNPSFLHSTTNTQEGENVPFNAFGPSPGNTHFQSQGAYDHTSSVMGGIQFSGHSESLGHADQRWFRPEASSFCEQVLGYREQDWILPQGSFGVNESPGYHGQDWDQLTETYNESGQTYQSQGTNTDSHYGLSSSLVQEPQIGHWPPAGNSSQNFLQTPEANYGTFFESGLTGNDTQMTTNIGPPRNSMYEGFSAPTPEAWHPDAFSPETDGGPVTPYTSQMYNVALPNVDSGPHTPGFNYSSPQRNPSKGNFLMEGSHMSPGADYPPGDFDMHSPQSQYYGA